MINKNKISVLVKNPKFQIFSAVFICIAAVYAMVYLDVVSRAREAYLEGEKYLSWHENPSQKKEYLDAELDERLKALKKELERGRISSEEYADKVDIAKFDYERNMEESSIKYAYIWYQTVVELFTPPESKWVKKSRVKMTAAKELWKQELKNKNIPFEDYMLE